MNDADPLAFRYCRGTTGSNHLAQGFFGDFEQSGFGAQFEQKYLPCNASSTLDMTGLTICDCSVLVYLVDNFHYGLSVGFRDYTKINQCPLSLTCHAGWRFLTSGFDGGCSLLSVVWKSFSTMVPGMSLLAFLTVWAAIMCSINNGPSSNCS